MTMATGRDPLAARGSTRCPPASLMCSLFFSWGLFCLAVNRAALTVGATPAAPGTAPTATEAEGADGDVDYLVIGAGGGGIQMALFLQGHGRSYSVLEKESAAGFFWTRFPPHGELISVNKWTRNETQRLRYDWHSMLEAPLRMLDVTEDYFPQGMDWHGYMNRVVETAGLNVEYGVEVERIVAGGVDGRPCAVLRGGGERRCARRRMFVGTGLREKDEPYLRAMGGVPYSSFTRDMARRRRVCILGNGNAGFETAQNVFGVADRVTIYGKESHRLSAVTKYTGDVRVKFLQVLENLHGKLLDTVEKYDYSLRLGGLEGYLNETQIERVNLLLRSGTTLKQFKCERLVIATGFESHVPGKSFETRFPPTNDWYEAADMPNVHYIGYLMHEGDFRRGAGGFLSGYRYLIRNLARHVRSEDDGVPYPRLVMNKEEAIAHAVARFQVADDLVILQDGVVVRDVIVPVSPDNDVYHYYEGISYRFHRDILGRDGTVSLFFAWGDGRTVNTVFDNVLRFSDTNRLINLFLHPVVEAGGAARACMEDLEQAWNSPGYVSSIAMVVRQALDGDLSAFGERPPHPYSRAVVNDTEEPFEAANERGLIDEDFVQALWRAVKAEGGEGEMDALRAAARKWLPHLFEDNQFASEAEAR